MKIKMPKNLKDRTDAIFVEWGRSLEFGRAKSGHGLVLRVGEKDDPEKLRKQAMAYLQAVVDDDLLGE